MGIFAPVAMMKNRINKPNDTSEKGRVLSVHPSIFFCFPFSPYFIISGLWRYLTNAGISLPDRLLTSAGNEIRALIFLWPLRLEDNGATHR